ncbi:MAG: T9SS type A sorting domain-containing protein [Bacteroidota bacterium]
MKKLLHVSTTIAICCENTRSVFHQLFIFFLLLCCISINAQNTWTGTVDTDWNTAGNWTGGIPVASDDVIIPDVTNDPIIASGQAAVAASVTVEANASLTIQPNGSLTIDGSSGNGLTNNGSINNAGEINIDNTIEHGLLCSNSDFQNSGTINIGQNGGFDNITLDGINNEGSFTNLSGGTINMNNTDRFGLSHVDGTFLNAGNINLGLNGANNNVTFPIINEDSFTNDGIIKIDKCRLDGILNQNDGVFYNNSEGEIHVITNFAGGSGIFNETVFYNKGLIVLGEGGAIANIGIRNTNSSTSVFYNEPGGELYIRNTVNEGIFNRHEFYNNGGTIDFEFIGREAIYNALGTFENTDGGGLTYDNIDDDGIWNTNSGDFLNDATINIGTRDGNIGKSGFRNNGNMTNGPCGKINLDHYLNNPGVFNNSGLFNVNTPETHTNTGTLDNEGIINYLQLPEIPNVINNEVIMTASTFSVCEDFNPVFELGTTVDLIVGIFTDEAATVSAGSYDVLTNTFEPDGFLTETTHIFYVKFEDSATGCTQIVPWELTPSNCCPEVVTCYLDNDGDGFGDAASREEFCQVCDGGYVLDNTDCNDMESAAYPGAEEICDGIDNDCDGVIDGGTAGSLTYTGNIVFATQVQVDSFLDCYGIIDGNVIFQNTDIVDLSNLSQLTEITGNMTFYVTGLSNFSGLENLSTVGGTITIYFNPSLISLDGLESLASVGGGLMVYYNFSLSDGCAIYNLINGGASGSTVIFLNASGCNSVAEINVNCGSNNLIIDQDNNVGSLSSQSNFSTEKHPTQFTTRLFPNPAFSLATLEFEEPLESGNIQIIDLTGRRIFEQSITKNTNQVSLNLTNWEPGTYFILIKTPGKQPITKRLIVIDNR